MCADDDHDYTVTVDDPEVRAEFHSCVEHVGVADGPCRDYASCSGEGEPVCRLLVEPWAHYVYGLAEIARLNDPDDPVWRRDTPEGWFLHR